MAMARHNVVKKKPPAPTAKAMGVMVTPQERELMARYTNLLLNVSMFDNPPHNMTKAEWKVTLMVLGRINYACKGATSG